MDVPEKIKERAARILLDYQYEPNPDKKDDPLKDFTAEEIQAIKEIEKLDCEVILMMDEGL